MDHQLYKKRVKEVLQEKGGIVPLAELIDELLEERIIPMPEILTSIADAEGVRINHRNGTVEAYKRQLILA
ncbi:MAG: hypothetical protein E7Z94_08680 [Actinomyces ruminicola]|nr:hypothetical protein [Actinomyces ruminicola]